MRAILKAAGTRAAWSGWPTPSRACPARTPPLYPGRPGDDLHKRGGLSVGADQVQHNFERYGLLDDQVRFLVGWFKDTLPTAPIEALSVMRLDGDMYESTWQAIEALVPQALAGRLLHRRRLRQPPVAGRQAIHDYRKAHGITEEIVDIDGFGAYWRRRW